MKNLFASAALIALLTAGVAGMAHADVMGTTPAPSAVTTPSAPVAAPKTVVGIPAQSGQAIEAQKTSLDNGTSSKSDLGDKKVEAGNTIDKTKDEGKTLATPSKVETGKTDKALAKTSMNTHHSRIKAEKVKATVPATNSAVTK